MYYLSGWPNTFTLPSSDTSPIIHIVPSPSYSKHAVVTHSGVHVYTFTYGECVRLGSLIRSDEQVDSEGFNLTAVWHPDDESILAVTTSAATLTIVRIAELNAGDSEFEIDTFNDALWHDEVTSLAPKHTLHTITVQSRVRLNNDTIQCCTVFDGEILLGTTSGYLQIVSWSGQPGVCIGATSWINAEQQATEQQKSTATVTPQLRFNASSSKSATPVQTAQRQLPTAQASTTVHDGTVAQVNYSAALDVLIFILGDGSAAVCDSNLLRKEAAARWPGRLLVLPRQKHAAKPVDDTIVTGATCIALNDRHRMIALGLDNGNTVLYRLHGWAELDTPYEFVHYRTLSVSTWGFDSHHTGAVQCAAWSPNDGNVLAVGWRHRGLVVWSIAGTRVACTLPQLPAVNPDSSAEQSDNLPPGFARQSSFINASKPAGETLAYGVDTIAWTDGGYNLLAAGPTHSSQPAASSTLYPTVLPTPSTNHVNGFDHSDHQTPHQPLHQRQNSFHVTKPNSKEITRLSFVQSTLVNNPTASESTLTILVGEDRLLLWNGSHTNRARHSDNTQYADADELLYTEYDELTDFQARATSNPSAMPPNSPPSSATSPHQRRNSIAGVQDTLFENDNDWLHLQIPLPYLMHYWPIKHVAASHSGDHIAIAGTSGAMMYNRLTNKWRRYANALIEQSIQCAALAWYGEHILVIANVKHSSADAAATQPTNTPTPVVELLFYNRLSLDASHLLHTHKLHHSQHTFQSLDVSDNMLCIHLSGGQQFLYQLDTTVSNNQQTAKYSTAKQQTDVSIDKNTALNISMQLLCITDLTKALPASIAAAASSVTATNGIGNKHSLLRDQLFDLAIHLEPLQLRVWVRDADETSHAAVASSEQRPPGAASLEAYTSCEIALHLPSASNSYRRRTKRVSTVLLTCTGTLLVTSITLPPTAVEDNAEKLRPTSTLRRLCNNTHQFWLHSLATSTRATPTAMTDQSHARVTRGLRLFTYSQSGVDVWFRSNALSMFDHTQLSELDLEVSPLGLDSQMGVLIGVAKAMRANSAANTNLTMTGALVPRTLSNGSNAAASPRKQSSVDLDRTGTPDVYYRIQTKLQPYLHAVLHHLIVTGMRAAERSNKQPANGDARSASRQQAITMAEACRSHEYFTVALELLLHTSLMAIEDASDDTAAKQLTTTLHQVIDFLRHFHEYPDIVVSVARKNDSSCWPVLFEHAGLPVTLFEGCLTGLKLRTASKYLVIVQRMIGVQEAHHLAKRLLDQLQQQEQQQAGPATETKKNDTVEWSWPWQASPQWAKLHGQSQSLPLDATSTLLSSSVEATGDDDDEDAVSQTSMPSLALNTTVTYSRLQARQRQARRELMNEVRRFLAMTAPVAGTQINSSMNGHTKGAAPSSLDGQRPQQLQMGNGTVHTNGQKSARTKQQQQKAEADVLSPYDKEQPLVSPLRQLNQGRVDGTQDEEGGNCRIM